MDRLVIKATIQVETGLHIGASDSFSAIGAIDSPVIRDVISNLPIIPGSSIKGKLRSLLAGKLNPPSMNAKTDFNDDAPEIKRLFGSSKPVKHSRLIFSDCMFSNRKELEELGIMTATEAKTENSIDRLTSVANPRTIERVIRGSQFDCRIVYVLENEEDFQADMEHLALAIRLLEHDYLGGHGSRGYGRVTFSDLSVESVLGEADDEAAKAQAILEAR